MSEIKRYMEYCTGCGLCKVVNVKFEREKNGYESPKLVEENIEFCKNVCPASGKALLNYQNGSIWGSFEKIFLGWSRNESIRYNASSGGVLTSICIYLLESKLVDGIIQTRACIGKAYATEVVMSRNTREVLSCMGSRYASSSPLSSINNMIFSGEKYAFVGKPCDVSALRLYLDTLDKNESIWQQIKYLFSFFCAGQPSEKANLKLIEELGCSNPDDCEILQYRGNGWPGFATAIKKDGTSNQISYNDSWGKILGRDVRKSCRFCMDGTGELADIVCGDAWHLTLDKKPDFSEAKGQNIVFARTQVGLDLLSNIKVQDYIYLEDYVNLEDLKYIQTYQYERKACMKGMMIAMHLFGKITPMYSSRKLRKFTRFVPLSKRVRRFFGICKRVIKGKM